MPREALSLATVLFFARHALATALLVATAWAAGRLVLRRWAGPVPAAITLAVGLAACGQALLILGLLGILLPLPIVALVVAIHGAAVSEWRRAARDWRASLALPEAPSSRAFVMAAGSLALLLWVLALYPPVAFDETMYHLPFIRSFAESGSLPFLADLRVPVFPALAEVLGVPLYVLGDDVDTHAISWLAALATAGVLAAWVRLHATALAAQLAAGLWLGTPIVVYLSGVGYIEPVLTMFVTGALYALARSREPAVARGWLLLAGGLAGSAAAVKYHGLFFVGALAIYLCCEVRRELSARCRRLGAFGFGAGFAMLISYGRIVWHTGNPLFPFYPRLFGSSLWDPAGQVAPSAAANLLDFVTLPWRLVFDRGSVGGQPPHSLALLLALPVAVAAAWRLPSARWPLALATAYAFLSPMDARYLVPAVPAAAFAVALGSTRWRPYLLHALLALALLVGLLYGVWSGGRRGPLPTETAGREAYLVRWLPLYPAVRFLNELRPNGYSALGVYAENMVYLARGRWLGDWVGPLAYGRVSPLLADGEALAKELRRQQVEFLVLPLGRLARPAWLSTSSRFTKIYADPLAEIYAVAPPRAGPAGAAPRMAL
jgi:4-amino-4-deoxy-L-arabinose transferase-like glycosyltransferase